MPIFAEVLIDRTSRWNAWQRYLAATGLVAAAAALRLVFDPMLAGYNYFLFMFAVTLSGLFLNHLSSIFATALSAFIVTFFFVEPRFSVQLSRADTGALVFFLACCLLVGIACESVRKLAEELRQQRLQRETLHRELRHRVANNLQIIGATLSIQAARSTTPETRDSLKAVADRISGIARVDKLLHLGGESQQIDACDYLKQLCDEIASSLVAQRPISVLCEAEAVTVSPDLAETLGVALNELVTNAIKHAFAEGSPGHIIVRFDHTDENLRLTVEDNGKGCPQGARSGTGWKLIASLLGRHDGTMLTEPATPGCRAVVIVPRA